MFRGFNERFLARENTVPIYVFLLTVSELAAPFGSVLDYSFLQAFIGVLCSIVGLAVFLDIYCQLKNHRLLGGRIRASTLFVIALPVVVSTILVLIYYDEWFGRNARH